MLQNGKVVPVDLTENSSNIIDASRPITGVIIGKFMPPHRGHEYLAQFASAFVDRLWIFVCSLPNEPIPGELRYQWMKDLFPQAQIIHIHEVNPAANRNQAGAQKIWANAVIRHTGSPPDYIFASEEYGWAFAEALGAQFIPVDPSRDQFPISGSELRLHPFRNWHFLPSVVRSYFVKQIIIQLPKSDQKHSDEIIQKVALLLNTMYVPVYYDFYKQFNGTQRHSLNNESYSRAQYSLIKSLKNQARCFLIRSHRELENLGTIEPFDLIISLNLNTAETSFQTIQEGQNTEKSGQNSIKTLQVNSPLNMVAHAIRDAILDHYKELF